MEDEGDDVNECKDVNTIKLSDVICSKIFQDSLQQSELQKRHLHLPTLTASCHNSSLIADKTSSMLLPPSSSSFK